jgi:endonuclease/exonuclease/phosphatase family metal-dependent hydrolase
VEIGARGSDWTRLHPFQLHEQVLQDVLGFVRRDLAGAEVTEQRRPVLEEGRLDSCCSRFRFENDDASPCRATDLSRRAGLSSGHNVSNADRLAAEQRIWQVRFDTVFRAGVRHRSNAVEERMMVRRWCLFLCASFGTLWSIAAPGQSAGAEQNPPFDGALSVMTYNVKGAPWPVTSGRGRDLRAIAERLGQLRHVGRNPQIAILQEAFSADARAIARRAGYRYVAAGPSSEQRTTYPVSEADARFLAGRHMWRGERFGKLFDSGLLILSDFPITRTSRIAYPAFACAGFDCMANKGALLATIEIPGAPAPVDIVATHLNSRRSAHVADGRSLYAYERQIDLLSAFIQANRDPNHPLIVAGDFNVGAASTRGTALYAAVARWGGGEAPVGALATVAANDEAGRQVLGQDAIAAIHRNTDFEFVAAGRRAELTPRDVNVPFGVEPSGRMLSDHIGYAITFRLAPIPLDTGATGAGSLRAGIIHAP